MADGKTGALLAADDNFVLLNELADEFESNRGFVQLDFVKFGESVYEIGGSYRLAHAILPGTTFDKVIEQEGDDVIGLQESAVFVDDAEAIGVAIGGNSDVGFLLAHLFAQRFE